jgi:phosphoribosylaminoimidazole-succinocarboxamide synthase
MATIPEAVSRQYVSGLKLVSRGKVRDTYALPNPDVLAPLASDRVSIFDFVLNGEVPQKGEVLTAMNAFWIRQMPPAISQDAVHIGGAINGDLPDHLRGNTTLQKRVITVSRLKMLPVEAIIRGYLTGSGWSAYMATAPDHKVCGHTLPPGLKDGDALPTNIFTPTTKAEKGHDEHMTADAVRERFGGRMEQMSLELFAIASRIALERGIILADTKLEFGVDPTLADNAPSAMHRLVLGDERFTPDSSRFWLAEDWKNSRAKGTSPTSFDKQFVRNWGKGHDVHNRNPLIEDDVKYVHSLTIPQHVLLPTRQIYRYIFYLLTGMRLEVFQRQEMHISTPLQPIEVILGSESDLPQAQAGLNYLSEEGVPFRLHIISCHRNPDELRRYAEFVIPNNATVIAGAGKAAALPGVLQSWLCHYNKGYIPVLGVAFSSDNAEDEEAAVLSIERLPGNPVVLNERDQAYLGASGFTEACADAATREFFIPPSSPKPARLCVEVAATARA